MIAKVREVTLEDRRHTTHDVCNCVGLSYGSCQCILADELNMRRIAANFVPRLLNNDRETIRFRCALSCKKQLDMIPTSCPVYDYDPETKQQSSQWMTPSSL